MVGIYAKLKNYFSDLPEKINKGAYKYVLPAISAAGKFAGYAGKYAPLANTLVPGLGTGLQWGAQALRTAGGIADESLKEDWGDSFGISDFTENLVSGKYAKNPFKGIRSGSNSNGSHKRSRKPKGSDFAMNPDDLHPRLKLKSGSESFVEELPDDYPLE
jgi:hypothetical protein